MPALYKFRYYTDPLGASDVKEAHDAGSGKLHGKFLSRITTLALLPLNEWRMPHFKLLHGKYAGLGEIRFMADGVQQRPLGFHTQNSEFVILYWAKEKGGKFVPLSACATALSRKLDILSGTGKHDALWIALE